MSYLATTKEHRKCPNSFRVFLSGADRIVALSALSAPVFNVDLQDQLSRFDDSRPINCVIDTFISRTNPTQLAFTLTWKNCPVIQNLSSKSIGKGLPVIMSNAQGITPLRTLEATCAPHAVMCKQALLMNKNWEFELRYRDGTLLPTNDNLFNNQYAYMIGMTFWQPVD